MGKDVEPHRRSLVALCFYLVYSYFYASTEAARQLRAAGYGDAKFRDRRCSRRTFAPHVRTATLRSHPQLSYKLCGSRLCRDGIIRHFLTRNLHRSFVTIIPNPLDQVCEHSLFPLTSGRAGAFARC